MEAETEKGYYQSKPVPKAEMDKKYGIGKWRPMLLFINEESGGKQRLIAKATGGGHNAWTSDEETLFVIAVSFAADAAFMITEECIRFFLPSEAPNWQTEKLLGCRAGSSVAWDAMTLQTPSDRAPSPRSSRASTSSHSSRHPDPPGGSPKSTGSSTA